MNHVWLADVLHPLDTELREDIAETATLGYNTPGREAIVVSNPFIVHDRDILKITRRRSLLDRLLRRPVGLAELVVVHMAGATFLWVERGYARSPQRPWRKGDRVSVVGVLPR